MLLPEPGAASRSPPRDAAAGRLPSAATVRMVSCQFISVVLLGLYIVLLVGLGFFFIISMCEMCEITGDNTAWSLWSTGCWSVR
jgi:hypothetical protein